jgi:hypothetical protein
MVGSPVILSEFNQSGIYHTTPHHMGFVNFLEAAYSRYLRNIFFSKIVYQTRAKLNETARFCTDRAAKVLQKGDLHEHSC